MPAPHSLALERRFARSRLLIVEPATQLQRDSRPAVRQNKKPPLVVYLFWWTHRDSNPGPTD